MMKRFLNIFSLALCQLVISFPLAAQPEPCGMPPEMTPLCADACIICDIDGFTGINNGGSAGEAPPGFCTFIVHNARWVAFQAGSENISILLSVSNCQMGNGLELAIYESTDCESFQLVSNCRGGFAPVPEGSSGTFENTEPLTVGQYYYIVMDGNGGDVCNWTFTVLEGSTQVAPLENSGTISGDLYVCPDAVRTYATTEVAGATIYEWTLDGQFISEERMIDLSWGEEGTYELCVTARNACDEAAPTCVEVVVASIPPTLFEEVICEGDSFMYNDTTALSETGIYEYQYKTGEGCDSTVIVDLEVVATSFTDLAVGICEGDSIYIGNTPYFEAGQHTEILQNYAGCDSTVSLNLGLIECEIQGTIVGNPVVCAGESSGALEFVLQSGTPPFSFNWQQLDGTPSGDGAVNELGQETAIPNLPRGTYLVTVTDQLGNDVILIAEVQEPPVFTGELSVSDYNGFNISCFDEADGRLDAQAAGGAPPYSYSWSNGEGEEMITGLSAGEYAVAITDSYGCEIVLDTILEAPPSLSLEASFIDPSCEGLETGRIEVLNISGGVPPYQFDNNGTGFIEEASFDLLPEGNYTLTVKDANGCEVDTTATTTAPVIPIIDAGQDITINLAESAGLSLASNIPLDGTNTRWTPASGLSCVGCPRPEAMPFVSATYTVEVVSEDDCLAVDSITIVVNERRRVYIPNAFSPNDDGVNDRYILYAGPEATLVRTFNIYSRWGEKVYEQSGFPPNDPGFGWGGQFRGEPLKTGIYAWFAEVEFLDGVVVLYEGEVALVR